MSLQVTYRPKKLDEIIGNQEIIKSLKKVLKRKKDGKKKRRVPSAFLFSGAAGCGKTTLARVVANVLKVKKADFKEYNAADERGIDDIRNMRETLKYSPMSGKRKFILLDEAHMITGPAQEALLKILEEPPKYVHIALCTTEPQRLKDTIKRRCHQYAVKPLDSDQIYVLLKHVLKKEDVKKFPDKVLEKIDELSEGSPGQALKLLDQVIDLDDPKEAISSLQSFINVDSEVIELCRVIASDKSKKAKWGVAADFLKTYKKNGGDPERARFAILQYLSAVELGRPEDTYIIEAMDFFMDSTIYNGHAGLIHACRNAIWGRE